MEKFRGREKHVFFFGLGFCFQKKVENEKKMEEKNLEEENLLGERKREMEEKMRMKMEPQATEFLSPPFHYPWAQAESLLIQALFIRF